MSPECHTTKSSVTCFVIIPLAAISPPSDGGKGETLAVGDETDFCARGSARVWSPLNSSCPWCQPIELNVIVCTAIVHLVSQHIRSDD